MAGIELAFVKFPFVIWFCLISMLGQNYWYSNKSGYQNANQINFKESVLNIKSKSETKTTYNKDNGQRNIFLITLMPILAICIKD